MNQKHQKQGPKPVVKIEYTLMDREFSLRLLDTWKAVSLIIRLTQRERRLMRDTFNLKWEDVDLQLGYLSECVRDGIAMSKRHRKEKGVQLLFQLTKTPGGIEIVLGVYTLNDDHGRPRYLMPTRDQNGEFIMVQKVDGKGQPVTRPVLKDGQPVMDGETPVVEAVMEPIMEPAHLTFERLLPGACLAELGNLEDASMFGMRAFGLMRGACEDGNKRVRKELWETLDVFREDLQSTGQTKTPLRASTEQIDANNRRKKGGGRKKKPLAIGEAPLAEGSAEVDAQAPAEAPAVTVPAVAPAPAEETKPKYLKLGSPEAAAELLKRGATPPADSSNGQG